MLEGIFSRKSLGWMAGARIFQEKAWNAWLGHVQKSMSTNVCPQMYVQKGMSRNECPEKNVQKFMPREASVERYV